MWVFFGSKYVKVVLFPILEVYKWTDVGALKINIEKLYLYCMGLAFT